MTSSRLNTSAETPWRTYLKAVAFLTPAIVLWMLTSAFFVPKAKELWGKGSIPEPEAQWMVNAVTFLANYGSHILAATVLAVATAEFLSAAWRRRRSSGLVAVVFALNLVVLAGIWATCLVGLLIAQSLDRA